MTDHSNKTCTRCGSSLSTDAAGGLCPRCLMAMNFESRTMPEGEEAPQAPVLTPEELAEKFPQFEILECLGRGGMGVVYKARQKSLNRIVAIKILAPEREHEAHFAERFAREAELLAKLNHPHIVTIHDFGVADSQPSSTDSQPLFYLVMEFVDGVNLRELLRDGKLEPKQALAIVPPICEALQYAHDKGIVHRDIKPENLLLDRDGRVKIADFGIAGLVGAGAENIGTPPYMAPEQSRAHGGIDHRADIYALGVVLYEMLTGERPAKDLVAPSKKVQIDVRLDEMVLRALEKQPELRYQTAGEFRTVVETMQRPALNSNPPPIPDSAQPRGMFRRWWWLFLVMIPLGLALGLAAGAVLNYVIPKKYEAQAIIEVKPQAGVQITPVFFATEFEILKSRKALAEVANRLELENRWLLQEAEVIRVLKGIVSVQNIRGTDLLNIRVRHTSAQDASAIANSLSLIYQETSAHKVLVHETAVVPKVPVSPNLTLNFILAALAGLISSPLMALLLMVIFQRLIPERRADARISDMPATRLPDTPGGEASGLGLTLMLHALLFAILIGLVFLVLPPWARLMEQFEAPLPSIARHVLDLGRLWLIIALLFLFVIDLGGCFLARKFGGRRTLRLWSVGVITGLVISAVLVGVALALPLRILSEELSSGNDSRAENENTLKRTRDSLDRATPALMSEKIAVEDLALHMIVAIREKDDAKLKSLASDRIKGWPDALPVFAVELREHFRQFTGNESFVLRAGESLVDGDLAAVRCTGPAELEGKCLVLFFVKTADGWRNHSLRNSTEATPLAELLADLKVAIRKEK
jgi:capsular polysaccharide biosynthesis protein/tRNA A-37 threonylcarbamoyl transferase component Bud32